MKVIFLDLDGVLNNWYHPELIDLNNLLVLKKIIMRSGAKIVITSSNKYNFQRLGLKSYQGSYFEKYINILKKEDIDIFDVTPYVGEDKSQEIKKYLRENPLVTDFVILDDEEVSPDFLKYQVMLDYATGLTEDYMEEVLNILNGNYRGKKDKLVKIID